MKITFLGTGTSQGVPVIGCDCEVCQSNDVRDQRLRTSAMLTIGKINLVIDAGPDFRQQMLRAKVQQVEAILLTHEHNDHIIGLDDVRPFNFRTWKDMPIYATERVQSNLKERFAYIFAKDPYPGAPMLRLHTISKENDFDIQNIQITPIAVQHGNWPVLGFRVGDFTYITDMKTISEEELKKVKGSKVLVLNALRHKEHYAHLNLTQALEMIEQVQPEQAYLTHVSHRMGNYETISKTLPSNVVFAYDGLEVLLNQP